VRTKLNFSWLGVLFFFFLAVFAPPAQANVTVLLEEPYSYDGALAGTGHTAVYLTRICAATSVSLRRCHPGEHGVVISRYTRIAGYDWIAIPLIPYLYAVDDPENIPLYADPKLVTFLRDQFRRTHLEDVAPDLPGGATPKGDWYELVGSSYDRTNYGFEIETTPEQDDAFIVWLNSRPNRSEYQFIRRNCADFVREVLNFYYPHSESRGNIADLFVSTPKRAAKSIVKYSQRHPDLEFTKFVIPQVPGSLRRSRPVRGVLESVFRAKKYVVVLAAFHPILTGGVVSVYLVGDRFNPARDAMVFSPTGKLQVAPTNNERKAYLTDLRSLAAESAVNGPKPGELMWRRFVEKSQPRFEADGRVVLEARDDAQEIVTVGVTRRDLQNESAPAELRWELLDSRLKQTLARSRAPRTSSGELREDWLLLQEINEARREEAAGKSDPGDPPVKLTADRSSD
jgi:hypothetical protein